jgi:broad specificity phosphatase PhoE
MSYILIIGRQEETEMTGQTEPRKLRPDLTAEQREQAERVGRLPAGQRIKTAWSMRVEKFIPSREQH